jgi:hypothetical protein
MNLIAKPYGLPLIRIRVTSKHKLSEFDSTLTKLLIYPSLLTGHTLVIIKTS